MILIYSILICFSIASFNAFGVTVTKNASSAQRSTIDTSRTVLVWIFQLAAGAEEFSFLQLGGFILLVAGTLVYNEIIIIHFWGFDENTKEAIKKREKEGGLIDHKQGEDDGTNYLPLSPSAGYDASKNKRKVQAKIDELHADRRHLNEMGLNKSELTVSETVDDAHRINPSGAIRDSRE